MFYCRSHFVIRISDESKHVIIIVIIRINNIRVIILLLSLSLGVFVMRADTSEFEFTPSSDTRRHTRRRMHISASSGKLNYYQFTQKTQRTVLKRSAKNNITVCERCCFENRKTW